MTFNPFSALSSKIFGGLALALLIVVGLQSCQIDRVTDQRDKARALAADTKAAFDATVNSYHIAAAEAERRQTANLARVKGEQEQINAETLSDYERRLADARRLLAKAPAANRSAPGGIEVSSVPAAPSGASETPGDLSPSERMTAAEQAIQLDELISWVERQAKVRAVIEATGKTGQQE